MNDIRFLNQLGDNLEETARLNTEKRPGRFPRGPRKILALALVAVLALAGGIAVAKILDDPDSLAANSIGCYESPDRSGNVTVIGAKGMPPVQVCAETREQQGLPPIEMVACSAGEVIAVIPGRSCDGDGLSEMPAGYSASVQKISRLATAIHAVEASEDCIPPEVLADRALGILDEQGWEGWSVDQITQEGGLPCGRATSLDGAGNRTMAGGLNTEDSILYIFRSPPRSVEDGLLKK